MQIEIAKETCSLKKAVHFPGEILECPCQGDLPLLNEKAKVYFKK